MPTYYLDVENGNDANDGLSFANRWKTFQNGATAARIAPGDTVRVMASPGPTLVGNATWTGGGLPGNNVLMGTTNASPIVCTSSQPHGYVAGNYVTVAGVTGNTNANGFWKVGTTPTSDTFQILQIDGSNTTGNGTSGSFTGTTRKANNMVVKFASPIVKNIALCGGLGQKPAWTASTNVTSTQLPTLAPKEGYSTIQLDIAAGFTTGKAAYYTLPATLDLSAYQQVCFWIRQSSGTIGAANQLYLALCSDTIGNTVVNQINIPVIAATNLNLYFPVVVNTGAALGASIQSIALYVVTDLGAQTFQLDNIIASKAASAADSVDLRSLISKSNGTGDEAWYRVRSLNHDIAVLSSQQTQGWEFNSTRGYSGTTETVSTYKQQPIQQGPLGSGVAANTITDSGTAGNLISFSGGWDRTNMSTQTGETWFDGMNSFGNGMTTTSTSVGAYTAYDKLNFVGWGTGFSMSGVDQYGMEINNIRSTNCTTGVNIAVGAKVNNVWVDSNNTGLTVSGPNSFIDRVVSAANNVATGVSFASASGNVYINYVNGTNSGSFAVRFDSSNNYIGDLTANFLAQGSAISLGTTYNNVIGSGTSSGCIGTVSITTGEIFLNNFTDSNQFGSEPSYTGGGGAAYFNRQDNTDGNNWIYQGAGTTINQQTAVVDAPATSSWRIAVTRTDYITSYSPARFKLGTIVCAANTLVTVTARMRRTNTGLTMQLVCPGGQISGVANEVKTSMTAAADTWETVTITFTPTKAGGVNIYAYAYGGTTFFGYVCNLTASQV